MWYVVCDENRICDNTWIDALCMIKMRNKGLFGNVMNCAVLKGKYTYKMNDIMRG